MSDVWTIVSIIICALLGAQAPFVFGLFVDRRVFEVDRQHYDTEEQEENKEIYRMFEVGSIIAFILPLMLYANSALVHSYFPFGVMLGAGGFVYAGSLIYMRINFGFIRFSRYLSYAASRMGLPIKLFLSLHVFLCIVGIMSTLGVVSELIPK